MPCHWGDAARNIVTQSSPTGSQCLPAVGCAEAGRYLARRPGLPGCRADGDELTYVSLGEGTTSEGEFWESLNTACRLHLPVLYVVADNGYAISVRSSDQAPAPVSELVRGFRGLAVTKVDGWDYAACRAVGARAVARVRAGEGPGLIHARVTRPYSHSAADSQTKYRGADELARERPTTPSTPSNGPWWRRRPHGDEPPAIRAEAKETARPGGRRGAGRPRPDPATVTDHVVRLSSPPDGRAAEPPRPSRPTAEPVLWPTPSAGRCTNSWPPTNGSGSSARTWPTPTTTSSTTSRARAGCSASPGGCNDASVRPAATTPPWPSPTSSAAAWARRCGDCVPCAEIQFFDYIWPAMQQLRSEAATIRWRSNGAFTCPLVVRVAIGGYLTGGAIWHSQSGESIFAHIPGLLVAFPSRTRDAVGPAADRLRRRGPGALPRAQAPLPPALRGRPLSRGRLDGALRSGGRGPARDVTSPSSPGAPPSRSRWWPPRELADEGCGAEVIDLRTIAPWDQELVGESVERTEPAARRPRGHPHGRLRGRGGRLGGRALLLGPGRPRRPGGRHRHLRRLRTVAGGSHPAPGRRHRRRGPGAGRADRHRRAGHARAGACHPAGVDRVVVIGCGFAGLNAARHLAGQPVEVTLIDQHNFHTFQPLLYQVATAGLDPADVAYPVRTIFRRDHNVVFRHGRVARSISRRGG